MFSDSITEYEIKKSKKIEKDSIKRIMISKNLSKLDNFLLSRTQATISEVASKIERDSGWEYFMSEFIFLSDFNLYNGDIKFTENKVPVDFLVPQLNDRELAFVLKYKPLLERLHKLEQKRRCYYNKALKNMREKPIEEEPKKTIFNESFIRSWAQKDSEKFMRNFGDRGVERLVNNLNDIANNSNLDQIFSDFMKQNISSSYKKELLKWAASYSIRGNQLLEKFVNLKDRLTYKDTYSGAFMYNSDIIPTYKNK